MIKKQSVFLSVSSLLFLAGCGSKTVEKPNIIFILADDMGYGDVSALNRESKINTPNIDKIAGNGVVFTDAHSSSAVSSPTRYGILTGRYNWRSTLKRGVLHGYDKALIPAGRTTTASMLKNRGYETACIGKWHLGWTWNNVAKGTDSVDFTKPVTGGPVAIGFDYFYGISASLDMPPYVYVENDMPTALPNRITSGKGMEMWRSGPTASDFEHKKTLSHLVDKAIEYINGRGNGKPFYLYLPLPAPHTPILPSEKFQGKSGLNPYGDFVMEVDYMVGRIVETLHQNGIENNTILVFTSDNGCSPTARMDELQEKGHYPSDIYRGHKADLYEGGHRIPCIVQWPACIKPHYVEQTVCLTDFMATFAAVTGYQLKDDEAEDSYNILPLLLNTAEPKAIREATVHHSINGEFSLRSGEWKLLLSPSSGGWSYPRPGRDTAVIRTLPKVQLYNIKTDPAEKNNVYTEYPEVVNELKEMMMRYIRDGRSTPGAPQKNEGHKDWGNRLMENWNL
ncbi:MAG: sulfatase-like hydrolase/transferase [Bacteroidales bacterium]|jgi:arylsulfatase A-like enzyme|nr:sulfatase-like hydrolase/transferase [Bacteroidales bacterium]